MKTRSLTRSITRALTRPITQAGAGGWTPALWFLASEQGVWYDPSDMTTMFQDSAGTTPVTAVEQPVGKILDKSGRGNHATQAATAQKPVLSARRNKLLATATLATQSVTLTASAHTLSFKGTGTVTLTGASTAGPLVGTGAGNRVSLTFTPTAGSVTFTVSGSVTEAQLEDGSAFSTYQRVTTSSDYDTVGFPHFGKLDRVDDNMTAAAGGGGTTGIIVCAAIRAGGAGNARTIWSDRGTNTGYRLSVNASNQLVLSAGNGSAHTEVVGPTITEGTDYVVTGWHDGTNLNVQANAGAATSAAFGTATAGTAGFTIGKDNGAATGYYSERIYEIVYRKDDASTAGDRTSLITYMAAQAGITL